MTNPPPPCCAAVNSHSNSCDQGGGCVCDSAHPHLVAFRYGTGAFTEGSVERRLEGIQATVQTLSKAWAPQLQALLRHTRPPIGQGPPVHRPERVLPSSGPITGLRLPLPVGAVPCSSTPHALDSWLPWRVCLNSLSLSSSASFLKPLLLAWYFGGPILLPRQTGFANALIDARSNPPWLLHLKTTRFLLRPGFRSFPSGLAPIHPPFILFSPNS